MRNFTLKDVISFCKASTKKHGCFKRSYEETLDFRDVCEFVDDYYTGEKDQWIKKYQSRFKEQKW